MSSSAKRALSILATVATAGRAVGVTEIARSMALPPGTVFRGLDALVRADLLARYQASSRYVLGHAACGLKQSLLARFRIREICLPYLRQLASATGETTTLYVRLGWYAARIATAPGSAEVTNAPLSDEVHLLGAAYAGRVILAHLSPPKIAPYRAFVSAHGLKVPRISALQTELAAIRTRGFALGEPVFSDPRVALALPIRKFDQAIAALAIEGPVFDPLNRKRNDGISDWRDIGRAIEALIRAQPALFVHPFEHIDADEILFSS